MGQGSISIRLEAKTPIPLDMEFNCNDGEIFVIVGPSGSGKTTTLRCIAGLYTADTGRIICRGKTWYDSENNINTAIQDRAAGFVYQDYALFPHLTVRENISLPIKEKKISVRNQRTDKYIQLVHLNGLGDRLPHQLSGGQQQRVAVARALARDPDILLLDEPFSSVDQQTRRFLVRELIQLKHQLNIPIIHVTHDLNEARRIADQLCIIQDGTGLQIDAPENVMSRPVSSKVAQLTGHDNIFRGTIISHDQEVLSTSIKWHDKILLAGYSPDFKIDEEVDWVIPPYKILANMETKATNPKENQMTGTITELIQLGEGTIVTIKFDGMIDCLQMNYSTHHIHEHKIKPGNLITVSLIPDGIHMMRHS